MLLLITRDGGATVVAKEVPDDEAEAKAREFMAAGFDVRAMVNGVPVPLSAPVADEAPPKRKGK